jgi:outer membrane beta-barrel protein
MNHARPLRSLRTGRPVPRLPRTILAGLVAVACLIPSAAHALQGGEDPDTLPVLIGKRYGEQGRLQLWVTGSIPLISKFTEMYGVTGGAGYAFSRLISVGVTGGFFGGGEVDVIEDLRLASGTELQLTDLHRMEWFAGADVIFTPIYGRISFASEYNPAFDLYALVGGGVVGTSREVTPGAGGVAQDQSSVTAYGNFGFGFRFHFIDWLALRTEYRLFLYPEASAFPQNVDGGGLTAAQQLNLGFEFSFAL